MHNAITLVRSAMERGELDQQVIALLKRWPLLHFSDHAEEIQQDGFRYGENNLHALDCTYSYLQERKQHNQPGYAFAFNAVGWSVENDVLDFEVAGPNSMRNLTGMYAESALLFSGNGLYTRHFDEFNQVICWGPDIDTGTSLLLTNAGHQEVDGEVVHDENGNAVECWTVKAGDGSTLISADEHLTLTECVVRGVCYLADKKLLSPTAIKEARGLYATELEALGLSLSTPRSNEYEQASIGR